MTPRSDYQFEMRLSPDEIIVDSFAGGGGASLGIQWALGRGPHIAINHDKEAIALHAANHPDSEHHPEDVWHVDPVAACRGRKVGLMWLSPDCFPAGTMVLTDHGYRAIETVKVGDRVMTHRCRWRRVTEAHRTTKPLMVVRGHGHPGLAVSPEHPFWVRDNQRANPEWAPASALGRGQYWASPTFYPALLIPAIPARSLELDEKLMWLAGRYVGDGWTRLTEKRAEIVITCNVREADGLREKLAQWPRAGGRAVAGELAWHERKTSTAYQFATNHRGLVTWLRENFGHRAESKYLPAWALGMAPKLRAALLAGYLSADGSENARFIECSTVSKALAFSVKALAQSLGKTVAAYVASNSSTILGREVTSRPIYKLRWRHEVDAAHAQTFTSRDMRWAPVRETVETTQVATVYNIGVEEDESYVVEGIVVHNCKHFSKAKGGKPVSKKIRGLAWTACRWAKAVRPRVIVLENVEEFKDWGPLIKVDGKWRPDPEKKGHTFRRFVARLVRLGYVVEWKELRACDFGAPTIRKRFFLIARCDGRPIVWPQPTHGKGRELPWRTAAECIDWSIPCPSIFERKKRLALNTERRIARGIKRYVIDSPKPFIVSNMNNNVPRGVDEPVSTILGGNHKYLTTPYLATYYGPKSENGDRVNDVADPLRTQGTENRFGLVAPLITPIDHQSSGDAGARPGNEPLSTVTAEARHAVVVPYIEGLGYAKAVCACGFPMWEAHERCPACLRPLGLVTPYLVNLTHQGSDRVEDIAEPMMTVTGAHRGEKAIVSGFLKPRFGEDPDPSRRGGEGQAPRVRSLELPAPTIVPTGNGGDLVATFLAKHNDGHEATGQDLRRPCDTVTSKDTKAVVTAELAASSIVKLKGTAREGQPLDEPLHTVQAGGLHYAEVRAFLIAYYGNEKEGGALDDPMRTVTSKERFGLVTIQGIEYAIVDIGMRMLAPRELYTAQGFPPSYRIEIPYTYEVKSKKTGKVKRVTKPMTKTAQVRMCGNSVCPPMAAAIISANLLGETFAPNRVEEAVA